MSKVDRLSSDLYTCEQTKTKIGIQQREKSMSKAIIVGRFVHLDTK